jgi:hypothetical protein
MSLTTWLREWRVRNLREQLTVVNAEIASYERVARATGTHYPSHEAANARELARIKFRLAELGASPVGETV